MIQASSFTIEKYNVLGKSDKDQLILIGKLFGRTAAKEETVNAHENSLRFRSMT